MNGSVVAHFLTREPHIHLDLSIIIAVQRKFEPFNIEEMRWISLRYDRKVTK